MKTLKPEDKEMYLKIVKFGTMDDMFEFGYLVGRADLARENLEEFNSLKEKEIKNL